MAGLVLVGAGCVSTRPVEPSRPPTPASVTRQEPGGDAPDPERAALDRLDHEPWGLRGDKKGHVSVALPDANNWRRVRMWFVPALTGFRYGDEHRGVSALFVRESKATTSDACLDEFEAWARGPARQFDLEVEPPTDTEIRWRGQPVRVRQRDGAIPWGFWRKHYAGVYASFPAWPGRCATLTYAFPLDESAGSAHAARDRFAREAFARFRAGRAVPDVP